MSLVDSTRGSALVEIDASRSAQPSDAMEFLRLLRNAARYSKFPTQQEREPCRDKRSSASRTDVFHTKVEVKNMNSIRNVGDAIAYEISRQADCVKAGEPVVLHTRLWDPDKRVTSPMRAKFEGPCVPDPSVPLIVIEDEWLETMKSRLPEMPAHREERFVNAYGLSRDEAVLMSSDRELSEYFDFVCG